MRRRLFAVSILLVGLGLVGMTAAVARTAVRIKIDWQPSPEYYGFFYAADAGFYREAGYDVQILYGSGAPSVAAEVATGAIVFGTTTSDNVVRWVGRRGEFSRVVPILRFNPSVIVALAPTAIRQISDLKGKRLGTNPQASYYTQLLFLLNGKTLSEAGIVEDPSIGFGGLVQLKEKRIDAMVAYTTNAVVDLEIENLHVNELFLGDLGVESYGLVLAVASEKVVRASGLTSADVDRIITATLRGYRAGAEDTRRAVAILTRTDPTIREAKADFAIRKIARLNGRVAYAPSRVDSWIQEPGITPEVHAKVQRLYK